MNSAFDTLTALRSLEASGLDSTHAEAIVQVVSQSHEQAATKADVARLQDESIAFREETKFNFTALRQEMQAGFAALRQEMKDGFAASREEWTEELAASRQEWKEQFAASRQEWKEQLAASRQEWKEQLAASKKESKEELAAFRVETEGILVTQRGLFQADLSSTVNRMLLAQVAVGGLVVAVLRLL